MNFEIFMENVIALLDMLKRRKFNFHKPYILPPMLSKDFESLTTIVRLLFL